ncbi:MAG: NUDIX hydrolase [Chloroflexi bacterium]|nr:NUDIX hydrolase [Chloroflexota bacterium]
MEYKVRESWRAFDGKAFNVRVDLMDGPAGTTSRVDIVEHPGAIVLIPIDEQDRVWLVRQYRHPVGEELLELPAGTLDPGEAAEGCATRESREEIGMAPGELTHLGGTFLAPGYSTEFLHFFLARELYPAPLPPDPGEVLHLEKIPWEKLWDRIANGSIRDAKTIAGLTLARLWLENTE